MLRHNYRTDGSGLRTSSTSSRFVYPASCKSPNSAERIVEALAPASPNDKIFAHLNEEIAALYRAARGFEAGYEAGP